MRLAVLLTFAALVGVGDAAVGQGRDRNLMACEEAADPDAAIAGCTALIQSGREAMGSLASVYFNRGSAYYRKGELDSALADYDQVIRLDPGYAPAFNGLGYIRDGRG